MFAHPNPSLRCPRRRRSLVIGLVAMTAMVTAVACQPVATGGRYRVRPGDTLSHIAQVTGVGERSLAAANSLTNPNRVYAGAWLRLPARSSGSASRRPASQGHYRVRPGEVLGQIAAHFGVSTSALASANRLRDANRVVIGTVLVIPASSAAPGGGSGLPSRLRHSPSRLALMPVFDHWAATYRVPPDLLKAVTWLESGWQQGVVSSTGAVGIGQLMPDTVTTMSEMIGVRLSPRVPEQNIRMSARYLRFLLDLTGGSATRTLAGYYQGLASIQHRGVYPSTLAYVSSVTSLRSRFT